MANSKFTLKRNTDGTNYDELYPKTVTDQVVGLSTLLDAKISTTARGAVDGVASLDADGKIPVGQLPSAIFDSLYFFTTVSGANNLSTLAAAARTDAAISPGRNSLGYYWVATSSSALTPNDVPVLVGSLYFSTIFNPAEENVSSSYEAQTLETGDWVVITKIGGGNGSTTGTAIEVTFAIVNNTYAAASSTVDGIVRLSDGNGGVITGLTGNTVITEGNLNGMLLSGDQNGAVTTKIAVSGHTHSQYQPVDAELTAIAALAVTDGNIIVGNGTTWVAESGGTARTSLGLAIGSDVQAYDAGLNSIAGLTTEADRMIYTTASDAYAVTTLTSFARSILDDADAGTVRTTISAQGLSSNLTGIANTSPTTAGTFIVSNGTTFVGEAPSVARTSLGVYSTAEVNAFFTNRPTIFYNTVEGAVAGSLILADVTAI
jgi:hypothetical protein